MIQPMKTNPQSAHSGISIGMGGALSMHGAKISQKSPFYDRLCTDREYINPMYFSGAELLSPKYGAAVAEKYARIVRSIAAILLDREGITRDIVKTKDAVAAYLQKELGREENTAVALGNGNIFMLAYFDAFFLLGKKPTLRLGKNYDLELTCDNMAFYLPSDRSKYKKDENMEAHAYAETPEGACALVHLIHGDNEAWGAKRSKDAGDRKDWASQIRRAAKHFEEALALDDHGILPPLRLSDTYGEMGRNKKKAEALIVAYERMSEKNKATFSAYLSSTAAECGDIDIMIAALRKLEEFSGKGDQPGAEKAAESLRMMVARALGS